ncbi:SAM-dependent methyltransferase [Actinoplanes sp. ATCC 53533]|uniref:class I SAM-dependent methyltransferase n=1 Tax=Actinoplanes sp. ATCC 53533 TaxID=1288362 RepID=UPI000F793A0C|nr:class I SAM-dependent methyltransferase [Actinoplanes sp. ATCC 53533]RSM70728.1 SAM-dependent methyltransferase [Actinoplanes sp. ATCC 53533]
MVYQLPLAYLLGLEGVALLRAFGGEHDRGFTEARIAEIRRLLDHPELGGPGVTAERVGTVAGYQVWSRTYDQPGNGLFAFEEPLVDEILDPLPPGVALDAACGTGRHSGRLVARGHRVIGVDSSPDMLEHARARVPEADFRRGDLHSLPVPDDHVDVIVCALALVHLPRLGPAFREFARVLRPGGHLLITDVHHETVALGSVPRMRSAVGGPGLLPAYRHRAADYLTAALPLGLRVRRCEEPGRSAGPGAAGGAAGEAAVDLSATPGPWDDWPWSLVGIVPAATAAAWNDAPAVIVWHFELPAS